MFFFVGILALFVDKCHAVLNHLENGETGNLIKVENDYITDLHPFYVGSVHWEWCTKAEREQVKMISDVLYKKRNKCVVIDAGMNDGFYTQLGASYGCRVHSFELQRMCIDLCHQASEKNGFQDLIKVYHVLLAAVHGAELNVSYPDSETCDGGFTAVEGKLESNSHEKLKAQTTKTFKSVSLSNFAANTNIDFVDFLKIDVEGFEPEVLTGTMVLFEKKMIGAAVVELSTKLLEQWERPYFREKIDPMHHPFFEIYDQILKHGYYFQTINCDTANSTKGTIFTAENATAFHSYALLKDWSKCFDIYISII